MAACGGVECIPEKPLPENPTFLETLLPSWKSMKTIHEDSSSFKEIFGDLLHCHKQNHVHSPTSLSSSPFSQASPSSSMSSNSTDAIPRHLGILGISRNYQEKSKSSSTSSNYYPSSPTKKYRHSNSFSSYSENLSLCTEGLGSESSDEVEDLPSNDIGNDDDDWHHQEERQKFTRNVASENHGRAPKISRMSRGAFPPPISCIGRCGKPWVCLKSYRENGRFILKESRIPTHELLHASREDGRLKLQFIRTDDETFEDRVEVKTIRTCVMMTMMIMWGG